MDKPFPAYRGDEPYVFVCYAHEDSDIVYPELAWLHEQRTNLWYDEGISAGKNWRAAIGTSLLGAGHVLFYISARSLQSDHCNREINLALDEGKEVVPIYLEDVELTPDLKVGLNRVHALHRGEDASYQQHLLDALGQSASTPQPVTSPVRRRLRWWHYAVGGLALMIVITATWLYSLYEDMTTTYSIAVLPFANMSTDEETGFLARGISESILDRLAQSRDESAFGRLKVASRTASFQFADRGEDLSVIAEKLNVAYVLEGSVQPMGKSLNITAQLIRAEDNFHVWSKSYDRPLADRFEVQAGVAQNIALVAESELRSDYRKRYVFWIALAVGTNPVAYGHLLDARNQFRLMRLGEGGDLALYEQFLKEAVEADPEYSEPYGFLAQIYEGRLGGTMSLEEARLAAHGAASKSLELNPDSKDGLLALANIYLSMDLDYANAETTFNRGPVKDFTLPLGLARIALREGRTKEALRLMATASELGANYVQGDFLNGYGWFLLVAGDYQQALEVTADALSVTESRSGRAATLRIQATALGGLGRPEEARPLVAEAWDLDGSVNPEAYVSQFARIGARERAERILNEVGTESASLFFLATGHLALDDIDNTFKAIEAAIEDHDALMIDSLRVAEWWDPIRGDPRFDDMLDLLDSKETHTAQYLTGLDSEH